MVAKKTDKKRKKKIAPQQTQEESPSKYAFITSLLLFLAVFAIIAYVRIIPFLNNEGTAHTPDGIFISDPDSCYHARRILYIAQHGMQLPLYDPLLAHPHGDIPIWSPLYDWLSALPSFIIGLGSPPDYLVVQTARIMTGLFGMLELFLLGLLVYQSLQNKITALLSVLLTGIAAPQVNVTTIEMIDHNSLLLLLFAMLLYANHVLFMKSNEARFTIIIITVSLIIAALFWTWPGSYIYIAAAVLIQLLYSIVTRKIWLLNKLSIIYTISTALVIPLAFIYYSAGGKALKFEYVSFFTVLVLICIALFFFALNYFLVLRTKNYRTIHLLKFAITLLTLAIFLYFIVTPLVEGISYMKAQNKWLASILESGSIFHVQSAGPKLFTLTPIITSFSYLIFIFPLALILLLLRAIKIPIELYCTATVCSIFLGFLMLNQKKFSAEFSIPFGMVTALFIMACLHFIKRKTHLTVAIVCIIPFILCLSPYKKLFAKPNYSPLHLYYNAFTWLKNDARPPQMEINSPPVETASQRALVGVLAPWHYGHYIHLYSRMPTLADNFGFIYLNNNPWQGFYDMAKFFLAEDEDEAIAILKKYQCKYVLVPQPSTFETFPLLLDQDINSYFDYRIEVINGEKTIKARAKPKFFNTMAFRLSVMYGSANPQRDGIAVTTKALKHFRLLYELPGIMLDGKLTHPGKIKIYAYVEGEMLRAPSDEDSPYEIEAVITTNTGSFVYKQQGNLRDGIIVPYPTTYRGTGTHKFTPNIE